MFRVTTRLRFIEPQLASLVDQPPEGKHWIHEIKHDGYRCQVLVEGGEARVFTRNGYDWSDRDPSIVGASANLRCQSAIIDGKAIVQNGHGASDFEALSTVMRRELHSIILYAFDLLHLDGKDLRQQTLLELDAQYTVAQPNRQGRFTPLGGVLALIILAIIAVAGFSSVHRTTSDFSRLTLKEGPMAPKRQLPNAEAQAKWNAMWGSASTGLKRE